MKKIISLTVFLFMLSYAVLAQQAEVENSKKISVPKTVTTALKEKYPSAKNVAWEKEDGNYEANWGGKSGEDHSAQFTPAGQFIEIVDAITINELPTETVAYINKNYHGAKITEAGKITDAKGKLSYEAEVHGKDILFDETGNFLKAGK